MRIEELRINKNEDDPKISVTIPKNLSKSIMEIYKRETSNIDNIIIFMEFLKEFLAIILQKFNFENLVEEIYELYSNLLNEYYNKNQN
jgi:hypothetical protein